MTFYDYVLCQAFRHIIITKKSMSVTPFSERNVQYVFQKAVKAGHLKSKDYDYKTRKHVRKTSCYILTPAGLEYLIKNKPLPIFRYLEDTDSKATAFGSAIRSTPFVERQTRISEAAIISDWAEANVPYKTFEPDYKCFGMIQEYYLSDPRIYIPYSYHHPALSDTEENVFCPSSEINGTDKISLQNNSEKIGMEKPRYGFNNEFYTRLSNDTTAPVSFMELNEKICEEAYWNDEELITYPYKITDRNFIGFVGAKTFKSVLEMSRMADVSRCRFGGVLTSHYKAVGIYNCFHAGMYWDDFLVPSERKSLLRWINCLTDEIRLAQFELKTDEEASGAMLVKNVAHFRSIFNDEDGVRKGNERTGKEAIKLGETFDHLYVIPLENIGPKHLNKIMLNTDSNLKENIIEELLQRGYSLNKNNLLRTELPVVKDNVCYGIGNLMDVVEINSIIYYAGLCEAQEPDKQIGIICEPWQEKYYCEILGDKYIIAPEKMLKYIDENDPEGEEERKEKKEEKVPVIDNSDLDILDDF